MRLSVWVVNDFAEYTNWWFNFKHANRDSSIPWTITRDRILQNEYNLRFYYSDECIETFAIEGDEKDIFAFIVRWS